MLQVVDCKVRASAGFEDAAVGESQEFRGVLRGGIDHRRKIHLASLDHRQHQRNHGLDAGHTTGCRMERRFLVRLRVRSVVRFEDGDLPAREELPQLLPNGGAAQGRIHFSIGMTEAHIRIKKQVVRTDADRELARDGCVHGIRAGCVGDVDARRTLDRLLCRHRVVDGLLLGLRRTRVVVVVDGVLGAAVLEQHAFRLGVQRYRTACLACRLEDVLETLLVLQQQVAGATAEVCLDAHGVLEHRVQLARVPRPTGPGAVVHHGLLRHELQFLLQPTHRDRGRTGVGHVDVRRHAAEGRRRGAGGDVLLLRRTRFTEVDMDVDGAGKKCELTEVEVLVEDRRFRDTHDAAGRRVDVQDAGDEFAALVDLPRDGEVGAVLAARRHRSDARLGRGGLGRPVGFADGRCAVLGFGWLCLGCRLLRRVPRRGLLRRLGRLLRHHTTPQRPTSPESRSSVTDCDRPRYQAAMVPAMPARKPKRRPFAATNGTATADDAGSVSFSNARTSRVASEANTIMRSAA